jgi:hypothetical protein
MSDQCRMCGTLYARDVEQTVIDENAVVVRVRYATCDECGAELPPVDSAVCCCDAF